MFNLDETEKQRVEEYREKYCNNPHFCMYIKNNEKYTGAIGGDMTFSFTPTSLGHIVTISCPCRKAKENITNFDNW